MARRSTDARAPRYKLLVEGDEDKRVIPYLAEANGISWGDRDDPIVRIQSFDGIENLLEPGAVSVEAKTSGLEALGILVDADNDLAGRWKEVRRECLKAFPGMPEILPSDGLLHTREDGLRLGVWLMPDNRAKGMLETFLSLLVPEEGNSLLDFARQSRDGAKGQGATFKDVHADKALIHTWLAWQDPPGRQLHNAILERILSPTSPHAKPFLRWFCALYQL